MVFAEGISAGGLLRARGCHVFYQEYGWADRVALPEGEDRSRSAITLTA
jgi:hypothetical protein